METPITVHKSPPPLESYGATPSTSIIRNLYFFSDHIRMVSERNPSVIAIYPYSQDKVWTHWTAGEVGSA